MSFRQNHPQSNLKKISASFTSRPAKPLGSPAYRQRRHSVSGDSAESNDGPQLSARERRASNAGSTSSENSTIRHRVAAEMTKKLANSERQKAHGDVFQNIFQSIQHANDEKEENELDRKAEEATENDDLPYWGPGILFYEELTSRLVKVLAVLDKPDGPGQNVGVKRGDVVVFVDAIGEDALAAMPPRKVIQAILGERGSKVRLGLKRMDPGMGGLGLQYEKTLPRRHFQTREHAAKFGVISLTITTCRDLPYSGTSYCKGSLVSHATPSGLDTPQPSTLNTPRTSISESGVAARRETWRQNTRFCVKEPLSSSRKTLPGAVAIATGSDSDHDQYESPAAEGQQSTATMVRTGEESTSELQQRDVDSGLIDLHPDRERHDLRSARFSSTSGSIFDRLGLQLTLDKTPTLWTRPVKHTIKPLSDPRWGTRMHFLVVDSQSQSLCLLLHRCSHDEDDSEWSHSQSCSNHTSLNLRPDPSSVRGEHDHVSVQSHGSEQSLDLETLPPRFPLMAAPVKSSEPIAELRLTIEEIASGFAGTGKGVNNWFKLHPPVSSPEQQAAGAQNSSPTTQRSPSDASESEMGLMRVQLTWQPAWSLRDANAMLRDVIEKEKARTRTEHVLVVSEENSLHTWRRSYTTRQIDKADEWTLQQNAVLEIREGIADLSNSSILMACRGSNVERVLSILRASAACLLIRDQAGHSALHIACMNEHEVGPRIVEAILDTDKSLAAETDALLQTPLHLACRNKGPADETMSDRWSGALEACVHRLVPLLLDAAPESALALDCDGLTPLDFAIRNPNPKALDAVRLLVAGCSKALTPEVLDVDLHSEWSRIAEHSDCSAFAGRTLDSELANLTRLIPDGIDGSQTDVIQGYHVLQCYTDCSVSHGAAILTAMAFEAFASATLRSKNKNRKSQQRAIQLDVGLAMASDKVQDRFEEIGDSGGNGDGNVLAGLMSAAGGLDAGFAKWSLASEGRQELLPMIMRIQDGFLPSVSAQLLSAIDKEHRYVTYRVADPLSHFQRLPLHLACQNHAAHIPDLLPILLDRDASLSAVPNWDRRFALHVACANEGEDAAVIVRELLDRNIDACREQDGKGMLPLHIASKNDGSVSATMVRMLLDAYTEGAACQDGEGKFPIDFAIESASMSAGQMVRFLFEAHPTAALRVNHLGQTLLHQALISALLPLACVKNSIDAGVRHNLLECFFSVDEDGSGRIELPELLTSLNSMGIEMEEDEAKVLLKDIDKDGNFELDFFEFIEFINQNFLSVRRDDVLVSSEHMMDHRNHVSSFQTKAPHALDVVTALLDCSASIPQEDLPDELLAQCIYQPGHSPFASTPDRFGRVPLFYAAASRSREASKITAKLMEHFPEGSAAMDMEGDTPLHYASAVGNVAVASELAAGIAGQTCPMLPQHISNVKGRLPIDMAVSLGLRLVLSSSSQLGSLSQRVRHSMLLLFSALHATVNFAWAVSYLRHDVSFTVYYIAGIYFFGVGGILVVIFLRSKGVGAQRDRDNHPIVVFKRYEAFVVIMPLCILHSFAAVRLEDLEQTPIPWEYWLGIVFSLLTWTVTTVTLDGSLCHATRVPYLAKTLEIIVCTLYRVAEKSSRIAILCLVILEYRICPCEPPGYDSFAECYCYSNFLAPSMLAFEFFFQLYLLSGISLRSYEFNGTIVHKKAVSSVYLRAFINLVGVHYGRSSGTTLSNFMLSKSANVKHLARQNSAALSVSQDAEEEASLAEGSQLPFFKYQASYTSAFLGEVQVWDTIVMVAARAITHLVLFFSLAASDGMKQIVDSLRLRDLSVASSRRAVVEAYLMLAGFGTVLSWLLLFLRYLAFKYSATLVKKRAANERKSLENDEVESVQAASARLVHRVSRRLSKTPSLTSVASLSPLDATASSPRSRHCSAPSSPLRGSSVCAGSFKLQPLLSRNDSDIGRMPSAIEEGDEEERLSLSFESSPRAGPSSRLQLKSDELEGCSREIDTILTHCKPLEPQAAAPDSPGFARAIRLGTQDLALSPPASSHAGIPKPGHGLERLAIQHSLRPQHPPPIQVDGGVDRELNANDARSAPVNHSPVFPVFAQSGSSHWQRPDLANVKVTQDSHWQDGAGSIRGKMTRTLSHKQPSAGSPDVFDFSQAEFLYAADLDIPGQDRVRTEQGEESNAAEHEPRTPPFEAVTPRDKDIGSDDSRHISAEVAAPEDIFSLHARVHSDVREITVTPTREPETRRPQAPSRSHEPRPGSSPSPARKRSQDPDRRSRSQSERVPVRGASTNVTEKRASSAMTPLAARLGAAASTRTRSGARASRSEHVRSSSEKAARRSSSQRRHRDQRGGEHNRGTARGTRVELEEYSRELEKILKHCKPLGPPAVQTAAPDSRGLALAVGLGTQVGNPSLTSTSTNLKVPIQFLQHPSPQTAPQPLHSPQASATAPRAHCPSHGDRHGVAPPPGQAPVASEYSAVLDRILKHCKPAPQPPSRAVTAGPHPPDSAENESAHRPAPSSRARDVGAPGPHSTRASARKERSSARTSGSASPRGKRTRPQRASDHWHSTQAGSRAHPAGLDSDSAAIRLAHEPEPEEGDPVHHDHDPDAAARLPSQLEPAPRVSGSPPDRDSSDPPAPAAVHRRRRSSAAAGAQARRAGPDSDPSQNGPLRLPLAAAATRTLNLNLKPPAQAQPRGSLSLSHWQAQAPSHWQAAGGAPVATRSGAGAGIQVDHSDGARVLSSVSSDLVVTFESPRGPGPDTRWQPEAEAEAEAEAGTCSLSPSPSLRPRRTRSESRTPGPGGGSSSKLNLARSFKLGLRSPLAAPSHGQANVAMPNLVLVDRVSSPRHHPSHHHHHHHDCQDGEGSESTGTLDSDRSLKLSRRGASQALRTPAAAATVPMHSSDLDPAQNPTACPREALQSRARSEARVTAVDIPGLQLAAHATRRSSISQAGGVRPLLADTRLRQARRGRDSAGAGGPGLGDPDSDRDRRDRASGWFETAESGSPGPDPGRLGSARLPRFHPGDSRSEAAAFKLSPSRTSRPGRETVSQTEFEAWTAAATHPAAGRGGVAQARAALSQSQPEAAARVRVRVVVQDLLTPAAVHAAALSLLRDGGRADQHPPSEPVSLLEAVARMLAAAEQGAGGVLHAGTRVSMLRLGLRLSGGHGPDPSTVGFQARLRQRVGAMLGSGSVPPTIARSEWVDKSKARAQSGDAAGEFVLDVDLGVQERARVQGVTNVLLQEALVDGSLCAFLANQGGWRLGATSVHVHIGPTLLSFTTSPPGASPTVRVLARLHSSAR